MIVIDTSALIAILLGEPERSLFLAALDAADGIVVSTGTVIEARMVAHGREGDALVRILDNLLRDYGMEIAPPGAAEIEAAHSAFTTYGKGNGHPAQLNFGDLFSYALAKVRGLPLLFKGDDFGHTDIERAVDGRE
ncbi:MAG: type II toxin-antitoxin system VapC family toxin [Pseudomonadota bacterium]